MIEKELNEVIEQAGYDISLNADAGNQYFTFLMADHEYGVDILRIQEIRGWSGVRQIPQLPSYIKGVIDLRGNVVPIIDLRERFGMTSAPYNGLTVIVVMKVMGARGEQVMGVVVDAVSDVHDIAPEDLKVAPEMNGNIDVGFIQHIATVDDKMVVLLDIDELLGNLPRDVPKQQTVKSEAQRATELDDNDVTVASLAADVLESSFNALTSDDVELLESSFAALEPQADELVASFYSRLFERYPEVKPMFANSDLVEQQKKLLAALQLVISNLRNPEVLQETLKSLGKKHQAYGAEAAHFDAVASVMLDVLAEFAGDLWSAPMATAWGDALGAVKAVMLEGYQD